MADACAPAGAKWRGERGAAGTRARVGVMCAGPARSGAKRLSLRGFYGYKECKFGNCGWNYQ